MAEAGPEELLQRARQGAERSAAELERAAENLAQSWPRLAPEVVTEGRDAVKRAAAALRRFLNQIDRTNDDHDH